ncbi:divalent-cation tolerance protein CutA [Ramlibacter sp. AN1133]|uniref:divalent-cation tolerance protein CutA n=1 Tax=Ramlibacter sp. AN1133 TaxID=3133429 RepID=UPI0030C4FD7A
MENSQGRDILAVTTTVGSRDDARRLARAILQARLAACVQVEEGLTSFYRWQGKECEEAEVRVTVKTLPGCEQALQALFREQHPYQLPQFAAVRMQAGGAYGDWVRGEVTLPEDPRDRLGL